MVLARQGGNTENRQYPLLNWRMTEAAALMQVQRQFGRGSKTKYLLHI